MQAKIIALLIGDTPGVTAQAFTPSASSPPEDPLRGRNQRVKKRKKGRVQLNMTPLRKMQLPKGKVRKRITVRFPRGHGTLPTHQSLILILIIEVTHLE